MKHSRILIAAVFALLAPVLAQAGVVVIAHPGVAVLQQPASDIPQLFLGRMPVLPDGSKPVVLDYAEGEALRAEFTERVLGKNEQQLRGYWTRMIFTGKAQPPRTVSSTDDMMRLVATTPGAIGYVESSRPLPGVKVLWRVE